MGAIRLAAVSTRGSFLVSTPRVLFFDPSYSTQSPKPSSQDHYQTLHISRHASRKDIKHAYYKLSKQYHPDVNREEGAEDKFRKIQDAYDVLGDARLKAEYDQRFSRSHSAESGAQEQGGFTRQEFRQRGPLHGRSDLYNYDEHFREHYAKTTRRPAPSRAFYNSASQTREELKRYWHRRENEMAGGGELERSQRPFNLFLKFLAVNAVIAVFYMTLQSMRQKER
jgi:curved DNA-binding protein CbpA